MIQPIDKILMSVKKPVQYTGGELGMVKKEAADVDIRFAFCFPDNYEVGMSHLGMKILYHLLNERGARRGYAVCVCRRRMRV